jgi:hypothetical protein
VLDKVERSEEEEEEKLFTLTFSRSLSSILKHHR